MCLTLIVLPEELQECVICIAMFNGPAILCDYFEYSR